MSEDTEDSNVVILDMETRLDLPPDRVLEGAKGQLERCVVIGRTDDNDLYMASSVTDIGKILYLIEKAKKVIIEY